MNNEFDCDDYDERREAAEQRARMRRHACQCAFEMPGYCPGPDSCPMVAQPENEGDE